jgi:hypothetical protein
MGPVLADDRVRRVFADLPPLMDRMPERDVRAELSRRLAEVSDVPA